MSVQDIFHTMKIVDILDLTKTVSLLSLEPFSPPLFLNICNFFVKNVHKNYSTNQNDHICKHCKYQWNMK